MLEQDKWYDFAPFEKALADRLRSIESADYFCNTKNKWLREAFVAGEFAQLKQVKRIRLAREGDWPDFEVELQDDSRWVCEATEVDRRDRHRGREYSSAKKLGYHLEHMSYHEMVQERRDIPDALAEAARKKLDKRYSTDALVIYLNMGRNVWRSEIEAVMAGPTEIALERFKAVWIIWNKRLYRCWPGGDLSLEFSRFAE
jgi:hypothetical protein